jgi:two-component sensor histidine kinase
MKQKRFYPSLTNTSPTIALKVRLKPLLVVIFWTFVVADVVAMSGSSEWVYTKSNLEEFVGGRAIHSLTDDENGRIWIGTQSGLLVYPNGTEAHQAHTQTTPWISDVVAVSATRNSAMYALTFGQGLYVRAADGHTFKKVKVDSTVLEGIGDALLVDEKQHIWIGTTKGVIEVRPSADHATHTVEGTFQSQHVPTSAFETMIGADICFASNRVIFCVTPDSSISYADIPDIVNRTIDLSYDCRGAIRAIEFEPESKNLYFATSLGEVGTATPYGVQEPSCVQIGQLEGTRINDIIVVNDSILLATESGAYQVSKRQLRARRLITGDHKRIEGFSWAGGHLWGLAETGLFNLYPSSFQSWPRTVTDTLPDVTAFAVYNDKHLLFSTLENVYASNDQNGRASKVRLALSNGLNHNISRVMTLEHHGQNLYAGARGNGLHMFDCKSPYDCTNPKILFPQDSITAIRSFSAGILVGTLKGEAYYVIGDQIAEVSLPSQAERAPPLVTSISNHPTRTDQAIITTETTTFVLCGTTDPRVCKIIRPPKGEHAYRLISSVVANDGTVYVGTLNRGVLAASLQHDEEHQTLEPIGVSALGSFSAYGLVPDSSGYLWIATNEGIWRTHPDRLEVSKYTSLDGLPYIDFNQGAATKGPNGRIFFGGPKGFVSFHPESVSRLKRPANLYLLSIASNGAESVDIQSKTSIANVVLEPQSPSLKIRIRVDELRSTASASVRYKLEGLERSWNVRMGDWTAQYSSLRPGEYLFRASGVDAMGNKTLNELRIPITVLPHWWQTTYAYVAYLVAFLALGYLIIRTYENRLLRESRAELEMQVHLAQEREVDELQAHVEATQHLAERFETHVNDLLGCVEEFLTDSDSTGEHAAVARPIRERLSALRTLQLHTTHEGGSLTSDLRAFTDDIAARLASDSRIPVTTVTEFNAARYPAEHAVYLAKLIHELLREAVMEAFVPTMLAPIIALKLAGPTLHDSGRYSYELVVEDNGKGPNAGGVRGAETLERLKIIEGIASAHNGTLELSDIGGTRAVVSLQFEPGLDT